MYKKYIIGLFVLCLSSTVAAQSLEQAKQLFQKGEFEQAKPVFRKLVKQAPSNANYNYWYGACCYETGEKQEAQPYLEKSAARKVIDAYRYLGKLYYDFYRFDDAVDNYEQHIEWLEKKKRPTEQAEAELEHIRLASRMIKGVEDVTVIDSFVVEKSKFLDFYKLSKEAGTIGKTNAQGGTTYVTEMGNMKIFSDKAEENGQMQLYSTNRLLDGWSEPEPISSLNEQGNVDYPFLLSDGVTLYYASDGEGSLGGYDIFVTRYDSEDGTYLRPNNIGMPFNSPANDYMYAIDDFNNIGWFASDRYQPQDTVCIYVFIPNDSKVVYDYENTDEQEIIDAASLRSIRVTWKDEKKVERGKQQLAAVMYAQATRQQKKDFTFIVDDSAVYYTLADFRSDEARKLYRQLSQMQNDYANLKKELEDKRNRYANGNETQKKSLAPSILDLEKRTEQLIKEIAQWETEVRNEEIKKLKH